MLHLVGNVLDFGPLNEFSCCYGEDINGKIRKQIFGTKNILGQLLQRFMNFSSLRIFGKCSIDALARSVEGSRIGKVLSKLNVFPKQEPKVWIPGSPPYSNVLIKYNLELLTSINNKLVSQLKTKFN